MNVALLPRFSLVNRVVIALSIALVSLVAQAGEPVSKSYFGGVAIGGNDTVAYHKISVDQPHRAIKGNQSWKVQWKGADWLFTSEADRDLFAANPTHYSPAYNGFCANALSLGEGLVNTDGTHWQIFGEQLYTFYAARGRDRWVAAEDFTTYRAIADKAWSEIIGG